MVTNMDQLSADHRILSQTAEFAPCCRISNFAQNFMELLLTVPIMVTGLLKIEVVRQETTKT